MRDDLNSVLPSNDMERNAYNAAFYELGLRWHWDSATWSELQRVREADACCVRHYLQTHQSHLLRAYDVDFLAEAIERAKSAQQAAAERAGHPAPLHFDWSATRHADLGI